MIIASLLPFALWIVALVQIGSSRASVGATVVWVVIVTLVPVIGPIVWLIAGKRSIAQSTEPPGE
ncbi:PLDc N-terminal domain-containing protein [Parafrigoribacterium soli]|uniref:PLDc N-terminal domain-containing protein n=1 Tax=Parafrigoribacterium soli TaxID=3144663 RepID=UPI0032EDF7BE